MGSMSRFLALEKLGSVFESEIHDYFMDIVGLTVGELDENDIEVGTVIIGNIPLIGSHTVESINVHLGWLTEEEYEREVDQSKAIITDFNQFVTGHKITSISSNFLDHDNDAYIQANIAGYGSLEVPLGFNLITLEFFGYLTHILTMKQRKWFVENYAEIRIQIS